MKKYSRIALSASLAVALAFPAAASAETSFKDVDDDFWAKDAIYYLAEEGIVNGYDNNTFRPNNEVTRSQAALMLVEALDLDTSDRPDPEFSDIDEDSHAYEAVAAVVDEGLIDGKDGKFMPNEDLTRAQMTKILTLAYDLEGDAEEDFSDVDEDHWAYEYVNAVTANEIASGYEEDQTFRPNNATTRAQFATFLTNSIQSEDGATEEKPDEEEPTEEKPNDEDQDNNNEVADYLKDVLDAQLNADSYSFDGTMGIEMDFPIPEDIPAEEEDMMEEAMNMDMDVRGAYQKDPLTMETIVDMTMPVLNEDITTVSVMDDSTSYEYVSDAALMGYPEEWEDKYIEYDYEEMLGEDFANSFSVEKQMEMTQELYDAFLDTFGTEGFEVLDKHEAIPSDVDYDKVIKFELTEELIADYADNFEELVPELENILGNAQSAAALGLSTQQVKTLNDAAEADFDQFMENLSLDNFVMYQAVNADNQIVHDTGDIAVSYTDEEEGTFSFGFDYGFNMNNYNEDVEFEYGLPENEDEIVPFEELMDWQEEQLDALEDFETVEEKDDEKTA